MNFCEFEQNENDAAIISSLLFLMDSSRELLPEDHDQVRDNEAHTIVNNHDEPPNYQPKIDSARDNGYVKKEHIELPSYLSSSVEPAFPAEQLRNILSIDDNVSQKAVDAPADTDISELTRQLVSQNSMHVAICSEEKEHGKATTAWRNERGISQTSMICTAIALQLCGYLATNSVSCEC